jgi:hypothetical protein
LGNLREFRRKGNIWRNLGFGGILGIRGNLGKFEGIRGNLGENLEGDLENYCKKL